MDAAVAKRFRAIWISDLHLGMTQCRSDYLLSFLQENDCDFLYLVGDIIDAEKLARSWKWSSEIAAVLNALLAKVQAGTKVYYIPGNHDCFARQFLGQDLLGIAVMNRAVHQTADGRRLLVMHGDQFCGKRDAPRSLVFLGDKLYYLLLWLNHWLNKFRTWHGLDYWSLSYYLKGKLKSARKFVSRYVREMVEHARSHDLDGVVCGHIHFPQVAVVDGLLYCNNGDWIENCTALTEDYSGAINLYHAGTAKRQRTHLPSDEQRISFGRGGDAPPWRAWPARTR